MIQSAAEAVEPGRAAVLGAGGCDEIPLVELVRRFGEVVLNDIDEQPLRQSVEALDLDPADRAKIEFQVADLSGLTCTLLERIEGAVSASSDAPSAVAAAAASLDPLPAAALPVAGPFDLVVVSCVLSQLHFRLAHEASAAVDARFAGGGELLHESDGWKQALYRTARQIEERFVAGLESLVRPHGRIYLSESVQMCFVQQTADGNWQTPGIYRMLRTTDLADYVPQFTIVDRQRWEWIVDTPRKPGDTGRMYDVQALVLAPRND